MSGLANALGVEFLKSRRSRVPWAVGAGFTLAPLVGGLFMIILKNPEAARRLGLLGTKAQLTAGTADWPTYLGMLGQAVAVGGGILFAFLTAWLFGREFADRTVRGLLAVATPRSAIVAAKLVVGTVWALIISAWVLALGLLLGLLIGLPGWTTDVAAHGFGSAALAAVGVIILQSTTAFFASAGRGYLPPLAWIVLMIAAAQILAVLGWGAWFPFAVPALVTGAAGPEGETAGLLSIGVILATSVIGVVATLRWWERADQTT